MLPEFVVIGAMKAGMSSAYRLLSSHPEINMCSVKDARFFSVGEDGGGSSALGREWYRNLYRSVPGVTGEVSGSYASFPECQGVPSRIFSFNPRARIVYVVRNPIDRALSHYCHRVIMGREVRPIHTALGKGISRYVTQSMYCLQLQEYARLFSTKQVCVLVAEDMWSDPASAMRQLAAFLGIQDFPVAGEAMPCENRTWARLANRQGRTPLSRAQKQLWDIAAEMPENADARALAMAMGFGIEDRLRFAQWFYDDSQRLSETFGVSVQKWFGV